MELKHNQCEPFKQEHKTTRSTFSIYISNEATYRQNCRVDPSDAHVSSISPYPGFLLHALSLMESIELMQMLVGFSSSPPY